MPILNPTQTTCLGQEQLETGKVAESSQTLDWNIPHVKRLTCNRWQCNDWEWRGILKRLHPPPQFNFISPFLFCCPCLLLSLCYLQLPMVYLHPITLAIYLHLPFLYPSYLSLRCFPFLCVPFHLCSLSFSPPTCGFALHPSVLLPSLSSSSVIPHSHMVSLFGSVCVWCYPEFTGAPCSYMCVFCSQR